MNSSFVPSPPQCNNINGTVTCPTSGQTLETGFGAAATDPAALAAASGIGQIYSQDQNAKSAYNMAYNLSMQHSFTNSLTFTLGYQGNKSRHLRMSYNTNTYAGYVPDGENGQLLQPFHDFNIANVSSGGIGSYDSMQAKIEKRYTSGLYFLGGYTWAHCLDDSFGPIGQAQQGGYRNPNLLGFRYDYGNCTQDVRNRVTLNGQYELPFGRGKAFANKSRLVDEVVGGWKTSLVFQAQSDNPVFITSTNQASSYPYQLQSPFTPGAPLGLSPDPNAAPGSSASDTQPSFICASKTRTLAQWFNPCSFSNPPEVSNSPTAGQNQITPANAGLTPSGPRGRVGVVGPGFNRVDLSLFKNFAIPFRESSVQLRADGFNVLNTPSFGNPNTSLGRDPGQSITNTRFSGILPDARVIQVAARVTF